MFSLKLHNAAATLAQTATDWMYPEAESNHARGIDLTLDYINWVTIICFIGVVVVMVGFAVRYRSRGPAQRAASQVHHSTALEIAWSIPPFLVVFSMFIVGFVDYMDMITPPGDAYVIKVSAKQWDWTFEHPNGLQDSALHVPAGKPVVLQMSSQDVIHSLFVPAFRVKQDLVKGKSSLIWFAARRPTPNADPVMPDPSSPEFGKLLREQIAADYELRKEPVPAADVVSGQIAALSVEKQKRKVAERLEALAEERGHILYCTEFCGTEHSLMLSRVVVHEADWQAPAPYTPTEPELDWGARQYQFHCASCHTTDGTPKVGPTFKGLLGRQDEVLLPDGTIATVAADEDYIRESIKSPQARIARTPDGLFKKGQMPTIPLTDVDVESLLMFIKTLK